MSPSSRTPEAAWPRLRAELCHGEAPALGPGPRASRLLVEEVESRLDRLVRDLNVGLRQRELLRAAVLLWHDHLDPAHEIVQDIHSADGSLVHAILHRREPDYANAKYWFRRAGPHPSHGRLTEAAASLTLDPRELATGSRLLSDGHWDPLAFVDFCEAACELSPDHPRHRLALHLQRVEFEALIEHLL